MVTEASRLIAGSVRSVPPPSRFPVCRPVVSFPASFSSASWSGALRFVSFASASVDWRPPRHLRRGEEGSWLPVLGDDMFHAGSPQRRVGLRRVGGPPGGRWRRVFLPRKRASQSHHTHPYNRGDDEPAGEVRPDSVQQPHQRRVQARPRNPEGDARQAHPLHRGGRQEGSADSLSPGDLQRALLLSQPEPAQVRCRRARPQAWRPL